MTKRNWKLNRRYFWLLLPLLAICYGGYIKYKEITMPPPLVFVIPDDYFGPIFFLFGQADGVELERDPLGNAVHVPVNGIVKLKAPAEAAVGKTTEQHRGIYVVSVSQSGARKILKEAVGIWQDDDNSSWTGYLDENGKIVKFPFDRETARVSNILVFPVSTRDEKMILQHDSCPHQFGESNDPSETVIACGKLLIASPNQSKNLPSFMWEQLQHHFASVGQLVDEANQTASQKRKYYKLP